jgi:hypothetical protein
MVWKVHECLDVSISLLVVVVEDFGPFRCFVLGVDIKRSHLEVGLV